MTGPCRAAAARRRAPALGLLLAACAAAPLAAQEAEPYRIAQADQLRVTVSEWLPEADAPRDWSQVSGAFTVDLTGRISVPFVGPVTAERRTADEVAAEIGPALSRRLGLKGDPFVTVELLAYRPVFVSGAARTPGQYAYLPGLTVAQASAMAGGADLGAGGGDADAAERALITASGALAEIATERVQLLAEEARLRAEIAGAAQIAFPPEVEAADGAAELMGTEATILRTRSDRLDRQVENLAQLKSLLETELVSLGEKIVSQRRQAQLARDEAAGLQTLAERGLTRDSQIRAIDRAVADAENGILTIETEILRVRQDMNRADRDILAARSDRKADLAGELRAVTTRLGTLENRADLQRRLALHARAAGSAAGIDLPPLAAGYAILRGSGAGTERIAADPGTALRPGDVLELTLTVPPSQ